MARNLEEKFFRDCLAYWNKFFVHYSFATENKDKHCFDFWFLEAKFFHTQRLGLQTKELDSAGSLLY